MSRYPVRFFCKASVASALLVLMSVAIADEVQEATAIRDLIGTTFDKPALKVHTDPIAIVGDYAIADWIQGNLGGRALVRRRGENKWEIALCAGNGLTEQTTLEHSGIPSTTAKALLEKLAQVEKDVPAARRHKFDLFRDKGSMK